MLLASDILSKDAEILRQSFAAVHNISAFEIGTIKYYNRMIKISILT